MSPNQCHNKHKSHFLCLILCSHMFRLWTSEENKLPEIHLMYLRNPMISDRPMSSPTSKCPPTWNLSKLFPPLPHDFQIQALKFAREEIVAIMSNEKDTIRPSFPPPKVERFGTCNTIDDKPPSHPPPTEKNTCLGNQTNCPQQRHHKQHFLPSTITRQISATTFTYSEHLKTYIFWHLHMPVLIDFRHCLMTRHPLRPLPSLYSHVTTGMLT